MSDAIDITPQQRKLLEAYFARYIPGAEVWAYGSRVKWTARPDSDLDLVVFTKPEQSARVAELKDALAESDLPFRVDLHVWDEVPESFREIIRREYVVLACASLGDCIALSDRLFPIPSAWAYSTLGVVCRWGGGSIQTGPFGSQLHSSDYIAYGIPVIMPVNIGDNCLIHDNIACIGEDDAIRLSQHRVQAGDIVYSRRGDVERRALIRDAEIGWLCGTGCLKVRLGNGVANPAFASYQLGHPAVRQWIVQHAVGATMPNLNTSILSELPFILPPLSEQKAIAAVLGALDDKIELNRKMNATLEEMAQALFKSWFVDFDPVRAKSEGRQPTGMDQSTADLFPDSFEESPLGMIPKGWRVSTIGEETRVVGGSTPSTKNPAYWENGEYHWVTPKDFSDHKSKVLISSSRTITKAGLEQIRSGLLPIGTVLLSSRAPVGYLAITQIRTAINQGFIAMICEGRLPPEYVLLWADSIMEDIIQAASGTTFAEISKGTFRPFPVLVPSSDPLDVFVQLVRPLYQQIVSNEHQSRTLATIRDTLLPKLLSGEIPVGDYAHE